MALRRTRQAIQNTLIESFNGGLRDELLNETLFRSLDRAREALALWNDYYNIVRARSAFGNLPPTIFTPGSTFPRCNGKERLSRLGGHHAPSRCIAKPKRLKYSRESASTG